ncbi:MAG: hypothetical protein AB2A00_07500 [Myxococcota bacterium]
MMARRVDDTPARNRIPPPRERGSSSRGRAQRVPDDLLLAAQRILREQQAREIPVPDPEAVALAFLEELYAEAHFAAALADDEDETGDA